MKKILFATLIIFIFSSVIIFADEKNYYEMPKPFIEMIEKYPETKILENYYADFLKDEGYFNKNIEIDEDLTTDDVPIFIQWDKRWAFYNYGKTTYMATSSCGPCCFAMVLTYFTKDNKMNPKVVAEYSFSQNHYIENIGTKPTLFTEGFEKFGLKSSSIPIDAEKIKKRLDDGEIIIANVKKGHFTTGGHYIVIKNYNNKDEFFINDPNSLINSQKTWSKEIILNETKRLWSISKS